jgi:hypothetical protein
MHTPTPKPTSTKIPTSTPLPTLSAEDSEQKILDLISNNGNCTFPCIWGITPGKTNVQTSYNFFDQFEKFEESENRIIITGYHERVGGVTLITWDDDVRARVHFTAFYSNDSIEYVHFYIDYDRETRSETNLILQRLFGTSSYKELIKFYSLPQILITYGRPSEVRIYLYDWPEEEMMPGPPWLPFNLVLVYKDLGVAFDYLSPLQKSNDMYIGCPLEGQVSVTSWAPTPDISLEEIGAHNIRFYGINEYTATLTKSIEEATDLSLEEFYLLFRDMNNTSCIETPVDLWP